MESNGLKEGTLRGVHYQLKYLQKRELETLIKLNYFA